MTLTEDHAPVYPEMLSGWQRAKKDGKIVEFIQWNSTIATHNGEHYVRTKEGQRIRTYGPCQAFGMGDYILRNPQDLSEVWVVRKCLFEGTYTAL